MKLILKFENSMNLFLSLIYSTIKRVLPQQVVLFIYSLKVKIQIFLRSKLESMKDKLLNFFNSIKLFFNKPKVKKTKKPISTRKKVLKYKVFVARKSQSISTKIDKFFTSLKPTTVVLSFILFVFTAMGTFSVYHNSQSIYLSKSDDLDARVEKRAREIASVRKNFEKKPYHNLGRRLASIDGLQIPTTTKNMHSIKNVSIDFDIVSSNQFISLYIKNHMAEVKDYIILNFQPIDSSFVLEDEGKELIRERIKYLINMYISQKGIEGEIKDIKISYLMGT